MTNFSKRRLTGRTAAIAHFDLLACVGSFLFLLVCCGKDCGSLEGQWNNREGQYFVFQPDGKGLWLTRFGTEVDSVAFRYTLDCQADPAHLDLTDFGSGPHQGKTLYAILQWSNDTSFRMRYEPGTSEADRPAAFDSDQTLKFFKGTGQ